MWPSSRRVKEVSIIFGDFFKQFKRRKMKEDTNDPGYHSEGNENTIMPFFAIRRVDKNRRVK